MSLLDWLRQNNADIKEEPKENEDEQIESDIRISSNNLDLNNELLQLESPFKSLEVMGKVCNSAFWRPIEKNIVLYVEIPLGYVRDKTQEFKVYASADKTFIYTSNMTEKKLAEIPITSEEGETETLVCNVDIVRRCLKGELYINTVVTGFKAGIFMNANSTDIIFNGKESIHYDDNTGFSHTQGLIFDDQVGYICKECMNEEEQSVEIILNLGSPYIVLPDGTMINDLTTLAVEPRVDAPDFDEIFDGKKTVVIGIPCEVTVISKVGPIS